MTAVSTPLVDDPAAQSRPKRGEPVWELAERCFPKQGEWTYEQFVRLLDDYHGQLRAELVHGCLEFLPMPSRLHEDIAGLVYFWLFSLLGRGHVYKGGYAIKLPGESARFPDVLASVDAAAFGPLDTPTADLAIEVVSPGEEQRKRDYEEKRVDYAVAAVNEYWIIDPEDRVVVQLVLDGSSYREAGRFTAGMTITSTAIPGFIVAFDDLFAIGKA